MTKTTVGFFSVLLLFISLSLLALNTQAAEKNIPEPLTPWLPWVMEGNEHYTCPFINRTTFATQQNHICAWPSILSLQVKNSTATFQQSWQVLASSIIPLPGNAEHWPLSVKVNLGSVPVIVHQGKPAVELKKGSYLITGQFNWSKIPQSIAIPNQYAFVKMSINGRNIAFPKVERNELWLQKLAPAQTEAEPAEHDAIDLAVARRVVDGSYLQFDTYLALNVSGKMREVILGKALPKDVELTGIESKLPAFLDADGLLHVKVKPGNWQILVRGYAKKTLLQWQRPAQSHLWPKDEIWLFKGDERQRIGKLSGAPMIDNSQAQMPKAWQQLPSYLLSDSDVLSYDIQHRGKPLHIENQLRLKRTLWLGFDNAGYTFSDHISGSMIDNWRLSMKAPYILESADDQDGSVLITTEAADERGLENRYPGVNINARGVFPADSHIAISGWQSHFETVSLTLNLPPGHKLLAVLGADSVSSSWWGNWSIWASFIVLLSAFAASRLTNVMIGGLTAVTLILIFQEPGVPVIAIVNFILAIAVKKHLSFQSLKNIVNTYWAMSIAFVVGSVLFFSAMQVRTIMHPQLESRVSTVDSVNKRSQMDMVRVAEMVKSQRERKAYAPRADDIEKLEVSGSRIKKADLLMERYQTDALLQAGSGIPNWQWQPYRINWHSPVAENQMFDIILLSKNSYRFIKALGVVLLLLWLGLILKDRLDVNLNKFRGQALMGLLALCLLSPSYSAKVEAAEFPSQALLEELRQRLLTPPDCAPECAVINQLTLKVTEQSLALTLAVHANADTAIALPRSEFWRPEKLTLDGAPVNSLLQRNGWVYLPVAKSISTFTLVGQIAPVERFELEFKDKPQHLKLQGNQSWQVVGKRANRLAGNTLAFIATAQPKRITNNATSGKTSAPSTRYNKQPFVKVTRELSIDQLWTLRTTVKRIAPSSGSINIAIPTLSGEQIISADVMAKNNQVEVTLPAGKNSVSWQSRVKKQPLMSLHANENLPLIEQWQVIVSPSWHAKLSGLPMVLGVQANDDYFSYLFYPYPGETLDIATSRPSAVKGAVLAIDSVKLDIEQGTRAAKLNLSFDYRSTRGGEHSITLPSDFQLKEIRTDNKVINLQPEQGQLAIPILPGKHHVQVTMRASRENELWLTAPSINLNAPVSNITTVIDLTQQRWILSANGPVLGPAVLYWGEFVAFMLLAILVARVPFSPLTRLSWLVLGFGLSLNNWGILMLVALWFASLTASTYRPKDINRLGFNFSQLVLYGLSIITVLSLLAVIPTSLLSTPNMGITGNYSYGNHLQWFADKSDGALPPISVLSIPILFYKGLMLTWVIWLSFNSLNWIKWAWEKLGQQGYWRSKTQDTLLENPLEKPITTDHKTENNKETSKGKNGKSDDKPNDNE
ncbi:MAG: hypothetical protein ACPG52_01925 [Cognaticolwellia sp.]